MSSISQLNFTTALRRSVRECVRSITPVQELSLGQAKILSSKSVDVDSRTEIKTAQCKVGEVSQVLQYEPGHTPINGGLGHDFATGICKPSFKPHLFPAQPDSVSDSAATHFFETGKAHAVEHAKGKKEIHVTMHTARNLDAYEDRIGALESERNIFEDRILSLENSKIALQNELQNLKQELERAHRILASLPISMSLRSGTYTIVNAGFGASLSLSLDSIQPSRSVLTAHKKGWKRDGEGTTWEVRGVSAQKYTIRSAETGLYANAWKFSGPGDRVVGTPEGRDFSIVMKEGGVQYTIHSTHSPNLVWTLTNGASGYEVILMEDCKDLRQRWTFEQVGDVSEGIDES